MDGVEYPVERLQRNVDPTPGIHVADVNGQVLEAKANRRERRTHGVRQQRGTDAGFPPSVWLFDLTVH